MFESHIPSPAVSAADIIRNSPLALTKVLLAAAIQKSDELAEVQAELETQRSNLFWLRLEIRAALGRAARIAKNNSPNIAELKIAEDQVAKGITAVNKAVIQATALVFKSSPLADAATKLVETASAEMRECTAHTPQEIEDRHTTVDRLIKTHSDISALIQSIKLMSMEISQMDKENQKDTEAENQLTNAREALGLRLVA